MKNNNLLVKVLCGAMVAAGLAGCKGANSTDSSSTKASTTTSSSSTSSSADYPVNEQASKDPKVTLVMAEVNPVDTTVCGAMDQRFKEAVEAMSGGSITIDLQGSGVLGSEADVLDGMTAGGSNVDISRISAFALTGYGAKKSVLLSLPYTFENRDHFWKFTESDAGKEILNEAADSHLGVRALYYGEEGFRDFFSTKSKPITSVDDMKGLKVRVSNDPIMTEMVQDLGATSSPVSMSEVYSSMQNGTIDAAEQPVVNYLSNSFQEVGPNLILDQHTLGAMMTVMADDSWDKLTDAQKQCVEDAGKEASKYCRQVSEQKEKEALDTLKSQGVTVTEVSDKSSWRSACQSITDEYVTEDLKGLYQKILDAAK